MPSWLDPVRLVRTTILPLAVLALVACGSGASPSPSLAPTAAPPSAEATPSEAPASAEPTASATPEATETADGPLLQVDGGELGDHLVDPAGMTLYLFRQDTQGSGASTCSGGCLDNWPPLLVSDAIEITTGERVDAAKIGTLLRDDTSTQVTYDGWPLYFFAGDQAAGDANGQGLQDLWFVIAP